MQQQKTSGKQKERSRTVDLSTMIYGKVPPQARDIEGAILGALMIDQGAFEKVSGILTPECFYVEAHGRIFQAIERLAAKFQPVDIHTVTEELMIVEDLEMIGGPYYLTGLTNSVVSSGNIETHARIILEKYIKRKIIETAGILISDGYEDSTDAFDLLDEGEKTLTEVRNLIKKRNYIPLDAAMIEAYQHIEILRRREDHLTGVTSGFKELDMITCGWQATDLIILAARPSVGKTALALSLARNAKVPVGFFSLEMSYRQLVTRLFSSESDIPMWLIRNAKLADDQMKTLYEKGIQPLSKEKIFLDDTASLKISDLKSKARRMVKKDGVKIIMIDYLQLITVGQRFDRKDLEIGHISSQLKGLAKELQIPVICLSQLSRDVEKRGDKEPVLSDLRESGAIEQDADIVMFLWRPDVEDPTLTDMINLKIEKNRNGSLESFLGKFKKETQKWEYLKVLDRQTFLPVAQSWKPYKE